MLKRFMLLLAGLAACVLLLVPAGAETLYAENSEEAAGDYEITTYADGTCEITGHTGNATDLVIPEELGGYRVTEVGWKAFVNAPL